MAWPCTAGVRSAPREPLNTLLQRCDVAKLHFQRMFIDHSCSSGSGWVSSNGVPQAVQVMGAR